MRDTIICDIDGTLADNGHRLNYLAASPKDWDSFFSDAEMLKDTTKIHVAVLLSAFLQYASVSIVYSTSRPERCRAATEQWLAHRGLLHPVRMRADGDLREDWHIKREHLIEIGVGRVFAAIDDRPPVIAMYQRHGVFTLQVPQSVPEDSTLFDGIIEYHAKYFGVGNG